jgi:hypothetical protein
VIAVAIMDSGNRLVITRGAARTVRLRNPPEERSPRVRHVYDAGSRRLCTCHLNLPLLNPVLKPGRGTEILHVDAISQQIPAGLVHAER